MVHDATEARERTERDLARVIAQGAEVQAVIDELSAVAEPFLAALAAADEAEEAHR
ncbi:hypothetical protein ACFV19_22700 [Streptomyces griseoluteus]|uniref:hypothetical protein n=1 Tax=Streptomyces griseoluteus TaxID=29306 RepID=UPI0036CD4272